MVRREGFRSAISLHLVFMSACMLLVNLAAATTASAQSAAQKFSGAKDLFAELTQRVRVSGFLDSTVADRTSNPRVFRTGDLEVDFESVLGRRTTAEAALVVNSDGTEIATAAVVYHVIGSTDEDLTLELPGPALDFRAGRFDVPFGRDWRQFASADRRLVSAPLTTSEVLDGGLNDDGLCLTGQAGFLSYSAYTLRGTDGARANGGRMEFALTHPSEDRRPFEVGLSYLRSGADVAGGGNRLIGFDMAGSVRALQFESEYVAGAQVRGFHVTPSTTVLGKSRTPITISARYDSLWNSDVDAAESGSLRDHLQRMTGGVSVPVNSRLLLKFEYSRFAGAARETAGRGDVVVGQMVFLF